MKLVLAAKQVKVTFTVTNWDYFGSQLEHQTSDEMRFKLLSNAAKGDLKHHVKMKCGSGSFQDRIDVNMATRKDKDYVQTMQVGKRKGYVLVTFLLK